MNFIIFKTDEKWQNYARTGFQGSKSEEIWYLVGGMMYRLKNTLIYLSLKGILILLGIKSNPYTPYLHTK